MFIWTLSPDAARKLQNITHWGFNRLMLPCIIPLSSKPGSLGYRSIIISGNSQLPTSESLFWLGRSEEIHQPHFRGLMEHCVKNSRNLPDSSSSKKWTPLVGIFNNSYCPIIRKIQTWNTGAHFCFLIGSKTGYKSRRILPKSSLDFQNPLNSRLQTTNNVGYVT